eukprot:Skav215715  [mRNA]  locus=scaffold2573:513851:514726:- [translate_table: standard]
MPGPWIVGSENPDFISGLAWAPDSLWEVYTYGGDRKGQGRLLLEVTEAEAADKKGRWIEALVICIEDPRLAWWFESGGGKKLDYQIRLHCCPSDFKTCKAVNSRSVKEFHTDQVRNVDWDDVKQRRSAWWLSRHSKKSFEEWRAARLKEFGAKAAKGALEDDLDFNPSEYEASGNEAEEEQKQMAHKAEMLKEQLEDLKAKAAAIEKGKAGKKKKSPQGEAPEMEAKKKKAKVVKEPEKEAGPEPGKQVRWFGRNKTDEKVTKKKKASTSSSDEKAKKKKKKKRKEDRGPY